MLAVCPDGPTLSLRLLSRSWPCRPLTLTRTPGRGHRPRPTRQGPSCSRRPLLLGWRPTGPQPQWVGSPALQFLAPAPSQIRRGSRPHNGGREALCQTSGCQFLRHPRGGREESLVSYLILGHSGRPLLGGLLQSPLARKVPEGDP